MAPGEQVRQSGPTHTATHAAKVQLHEDGAEAAQEGEAHSCDEACKKEAATSKWVTENFASVTSLSPNVPRELSKKAGRLSWRRL